MKDEALEQIWKSRDAISKRCDYDAHKLVRYFQQRKKTRDSEPRLTPNRDAAAAPPR